MSMTEPDSYPTADDIHAAMAGHNYAKADLTTHVRALATSPFGDQELDQLLRDIYAAGRSSEREPT